jgi:hypothetical protein
MQSNQFQNTNKEGKSPSFFNSKEIKDKMRKFFIFFILNYFLFYDYLKK